MMGWYGSGDWMEGGFIFMMFFWVLIVIAVVYLVRYTGNPRRGETPMEKTPLQILQERYAKGEIDKKEYEEKKKELQIV